MDIDRVVIKHQDADSLPNPNNIAHGSEYSVSVPLLGKMYDVATFEDDNGALWAVKTLKPEIAGSSFYPHKDAEAIFDEHIDDHQRYLTYLRRFVSPAEFYKEIDTDGNVYYCRVDRFINAGIQYKEALKTNRPIPIDQLPDLEQRLEFVSGIANLMDSFGSVSRIPDLDFFIETKRGEHNIILFDTGYFYHEHNEGKDRRNFTHNLSEFLFTSDELKTEKVKEIVGRLYKSP